MSISTSNLYGRLANSGGNSKLLISLYSFDQFITNLLSNSSSGNFTSSNCFSTTSNNNIVFTNNTALLLNTVATINNTGRQSRLYDAMLLVSRLQFPSVVQNFYSQNINLIDSNFINVPSVISEYQKDYEQYLSLILISTPTPNKYKIVYQQNTNPFIYSIGGYAYGLVVYSDNSSVKINPNNYTSGFYTDTSGKTPVNYILSKDWIFDTVINGLSTSFSDCQNSALGLSFSLKQYSQSFKPLIIVTSDGTDNSKATAQGVSSSLRVAWGPNGGQVLIVSPSSSGNENDLRTMVDGINSKLYKYNTYPELDLRNALVEQDTMSLFSSYWERDYDFDSLKFISYIYASFSTPGNSTAKVSFVWSKDRINFSNRIFLNNSQKYYLNQKVIAIYYRVDFTEDNNGQRLLPSVDSLYHVTVVPFTQTFLSYPQNINGQMFQTLATASFTNNSLVDITPIAGRTNTTNIAYYESVQLNRNSALTNRQQSFRITPAYTVSGLLLVPAASYNGTINYKQFYIADNNNIVYTWDTSDIFTLYLFGNKVLPPYNVDPASGIISFTFALDNIIPSTGLPQYKSYSAIIQYSEKRKNIIGEPTTTYDYKTYYLRYGRIPPDAYIVVLINQVIFRGQYIIDYYEGAITFSSSLEPSDFVSVFVKFANSFRAGLQVDSYSNDAINLQAFNFTYTSLPDQPTYVNSYNYTRPYLSGLPAINPTTARVNDLYQISYNYRDDGNASESGSNVWWWRKRTGVEYVVYNPNANLTVTNGTLPNGLTTVNVTGVANTNAYPFILSLTINSIGLNTNVVGAYIVDRGANYIGVNTSVSNSVIITGGTTISGISGIVSAYTITPPLLTDYVTADYFVRINPNNGVQYSNSVYGYPTSASLTSFPNYDGKISESAIDVGSRILFDGRDQWFVSVQPNNSFASGDTSNSNITTIKLNFAPSISSALITPSTSVYTGVSTAFSVSAASDLTINYYYNQGGYQSSFVFQSPQNNNAFNYTKFTWYKLTSTGGALISTSSTLSSGIIVLNDQIYCSLTPGVLNADGSIGYGNVVSTDIYNVAT
jgi:hypothetical protein